MIITAKQGTWIKKTTAPSHELPANQKVQLSAGKTFKIDKLIGGILKGHQLVTLSYSMGDWFIFAQHWDGLDPKIAKELITKAQAEAIFGNKIFDNELNDLNICCRIFHINTPLRLRHFMAQIAHESGGLKWLKELASGDDYEWRQDLGNIHAGDGRRFKGAGAIQLTGRYNYQKFATFIKDPRVMEGVEYVAEIFPFTSAGFWWQNNDMNRLCDRNPTVREVTLRVNGGVNGLADREFYYARALKVII